MSANIKGKARFRAFPQQIQFSFAKNIGTAIIPNNTSAVASLYTNVGTHPQSINPTEQSLFFNVFMPKTPFKYYWFFIKEFVKLANGQRPFPRALLESVSFSMPT